MDVKQKYIREAGFDVAEDFIETLGYLDIRTAQQVAAFIQENVNKIKLNILVSTILPGLIINDNNDPVTFAVEIIKDYSPHTILSDIQLIEMDEYLDLLNLTPNLNERRKNKSTKRAG